MGALEHVDVVVIGAGLSGIGAGYHLQTECPDRSYAIVEARDRLGGTWDLFRYPGVRSDSDMFTLGFPFEPWGGKAIADGPSILDYVQRTARKHGIEEKIRYRTRVVGADWSSADAHWTLALEVTGDDGEVSEESMTCAFLYSCAGYYDYENPHDPLLPGIEDFAGDVVHPQFWPEDLDVTDRRAWSSSAAAPPPSRWSRPSRRTPPASPCSNAPPRGSPRSRRETRSPTGSARCCRPTPPTRRSA